MTYNTFDSILLWLCIQLYARRCKLTFKDPDVVISLHQCKQAFVDWSPKKMVLSVKYKYKLFFYIRGKREMDVSVSAKKNQQTKQFNSRSETKTILAATTHISVWAIFRPSEMYQRQFENGKRKIILLMKLEMEAFLYFVLKVTSKTQHCSAGSMADQ